jgi:hypothetical protein
MMMICHKLPPVSIRDDKSSSRLVVTLNPGEKHDKLAADLTAMVLTSLISHKSQTVVLNHNTKCSEF